jgi:hypothetical protein
MVLRGLVGAVGSPHHETRPPPGAGRSRPSHTTTAHHGLAAYSRRRRCGSPRRQISPFVGLVDGMLVVGGIACIYLGGTMTMQQCGESRINEGGVRNPRAHLARVGKKGGIHRRTQTCAIHAIIMPRPGRRRYTPWRGQPRTDLPHASRICGDDPSRCLPNPPLGDENKSEPCTRWSTASSFPASPGTIPEVLCCGVRSRIVLTTWLI